MRKIKIKINGEDYCCSPGETIMQVAGQNGIDIPGLCGHSDFDPPANCRICVVEVKERNKLQTACSTKVNEGMEVRTNSERVKKARNMNIELIFAEHIEKCADCIWRFECKLLSFAEKYKILITTFKDRKGKRTTHKFANAVELDGSQCIDCRNCIAACSESQNIHYLELKGKGVKQEVVPSRKKDIKCILCGQCAVHCPVSAAQEQSHCEVVEKLLKQNQRKNNNQIMVALLAPSVAISVGEDFDTASGKNCQAQLITALKELGFHYVVDLSIFEEIAATFYYKNLLEQFKTRREGPIFTSHCPSWVNYIELYHSELLLALSPIRSPQIIGGGMIKSYGAKQLNKKPKNLIVVSITPCTAEKYEAARKELKINSLYPVDYVLTIRELSFLLKKKHVKLTDFKKSKFNFDTFPTSNCGTALEVSGGMSQALATINSRKSNKHRKENHKDIASANDTLRTINMSIGRQKLNVAVVNGIRDIEKVLEKQDQFDLIEVMACPEACLGGGGQAIPTNSLLRQKRRQGLLGIAKKNAKKRQEKSMSQVILKWLDKNPRRKNSIVTASFHKLRKY